jgi:coproporphyrinogen III oxidase-like Fe-S oxidoreductase
MLDKDLEVIEEIKADQVTFYPLMVSDITRAELARRFGAISYRQEKAFYNRIVDRLEDHYTWGTSWCFSRKKTMIDEYIVDYDEYVGAGSGSFGYVNGACFANTFSVPHYLAAVGKGQWPILAKKDFSRKERALYDFMMKLFGTLWKEISLFRVAGALVNDNGVIRLTRRGRYLWVIMMREFFTGVNNFRDICRAAIQASNECIQ